jgi:predicted nucleotidyltransferase
MTKAEKNTAIIEEIAQKTRPVFEKYGFLKVGIFGSRARGDNQNDSDIDLLFSIKGNNFGYIEKQEIQEELERILGVGVDLVPDTRVVARMRPSIMSDLKIIYEKQ